MSGYFTLPVFGFEIRFTFTEALCPVSRRCVTEFALEKFDEMRGIVETAFRPDIRYCTISRNQQHACLHKTLAEDPPVGRLIKVALERTFERSEAHTATFGHFFYSDIFENMFLDEPFERLGR